ncbi:hypothetical protein [Streptomyces sp. NPDC004728]|uniref:hypothetical protein n=1 Tax=Streptomyces sp. NPDC004728 TaxID=3154289 RepID=UPI0033BD37F1
MNRKLRMMAASVAAAVTIGIAAPAANAATHQAPRPVAAAQTVQTIQTDSIAQARALVGTLKSEGINASTAGQSSTVTVQGDVSSKGVSSLVLKAWKLLKKAPGAVKWSTKVAKKAYSMGKKKGVAYFKKKVAEMSSWSPIKWVWKTILGFSNASTLWEIIKYIINHA